MSAPFFARSRGPRVARPASVMVNLFPDANGREMVTRDPGASAPLALFRAHPHAATSTPTLADAAVPLRAGTFPARKLAGASWAGVGSGKGGGEARTHLAATSATRHVTVRQRGSRSGSKCYRTIEVLRAHPPMGAANQGPPTQSAGYDAPEPVALAAGATSSAGAVSFAVGPCPASGRAKPSSGQQGGTAAPSARDGLEGSGRGARDGLEAERAELEGGGRLRTEGHGPEHGAGGGAELARVRRHDDTGAVLARRTLEAELARSGGPEGTDGARGAEDADLATGPISEPNGRDATGASAGQRRNERDLEASQRRNRP